MTRPPKKMNVDTAPDATRVARRPGAKLAGPPTLLEPTEDAKKKKKMREFLDERHAYEAATRRVGSPAQQRAARDSTMRGARNLLRD